MMDEVRRTAAYFQEVKTVKDEHKTKGQLITELRLRVAELEKSESLRKQAEKTLQEKPENLQELSTENVRGIVHELQVHQVELEMQNEELRRTQSELEESRNRYSNLYDFAPIGYFTFDKNGIIIEANLTGANKLGIERNFLIKKPFSLYIAFSSRDVFYLHLRNVFRTDTMQTCEIKLVDKSKNQFEVQLESLAVQDSEGNFSQCRTAIIDITERKKAEKRLEASFKQVEEEKAKTESIIAAIGDAISIQDTDFKVLYQNKIHQDILGDQKGKYCYMVYEHKDQICERCPVNMSFKDGKIHTEERRIIKNEKELYFEITASPLRDSTGNIIAGIEVARDITERKRAEAAIQVSEERLHQAVRVSQIGFFDHDHRTDTIYWSPEQRHIYGLGPEEPVTMSAFLKHVYPEDRERIAEAVGRAHDPAGDGSFDVEHRIVDRSGSIHWLSTRSRTQFEGEGGSRHPVRTVGAVADITERKSAEDVLKRYQLLSQKARDIILFIRVSDGQIIEANQAAVQAYGYERQELVTKKILDLRAPGSRGFATEEIEQANSSGVFFETLHCRKDGNLFPVEVSSVGMWLEHGRMLLSIIRDITDRKEAEEQIKNSLKEKEMLLREIHHRVKNNMQVISSLLYLQSGYIKDKKYLEMFRDSQNRIISMSLIHEKLYRSKDLAKIEYNEYIRDLANGLFQSHGVKTGTIVLNINVDNFSLGIDQAIPCGLIINELINNSLKYAFPEDRKGDINVSLHLNNDNMVELVVSDNGVGFPSDLDFRKTESLGLRLVTVLAEDQLHGKIDLDRSRGTEFNIKFQAGNDGKKTNIGC